MIDTEAIAARGAGIRSLVREVDVVAPPGEVWAAWTTDEGIASWWSPPETRIDLRVGGPFEPLFLPDTAGTKDAGQRGMPVPRLRPGEMVSFTWNAPPHLPLRAELTWVVITFTGAADGGTAVRLVHTGFLDGPDWDDYVEYFADAWGRVLDGLAAHWER